MKKGFTLIELLAVIIILAVVALIATPVVFNVVNSAKESTAKSQAYYILAGAKNYYSESMFDDNKKNKIDTRLNIYDEIKMSGQKPENGQLYINSKGLTAMAVVINNKCYKKEYNGELQVFNSIDCDLENIYDPNAPILFNNMIPVIYENGNWIYANINEKWYDYDEKQWANAVVLNSGVTKIVGQTITEEEIAMMYVWIPRYKYTIFNGNDDEVPEQEINIIFEKGTISTGTVACSDAINENEYYSEMCTDSINGSIVNGKSTYTHPAFTFGDKELAGIWVGKFEISASLEESNTIQQVIIKPNVYSWVNAQIATFYTSIKNIADNYNINTNSHMMKNMEWGATAYLSHSKYGRCTDGICTEISKNNSCWNYTGRSEGDIPPTSECTDEGTYTYELPLGQLASTTGNIYGIYDMSGGTWEYVMGNMVTDTSVPMVGNNSSQQSNFKGKRYDGTSNLNGYDFPTSEYYDSYTYSTDTYIQIRGKLGDATKETLQTIWSGSGGWHGDTSYFLSESYSWFLRGGHCSENPNVGIFYFGSQNGKQSSYFTTRAILVSDN